MQLIYNKAESSIRPKEIEVGVTTVYFRKNIVEVQRTDDFADGEPYTMFTYDESKITKDQAIDILANSIIDTDKMAVDHEFRLTLLELGL